jgi:sec-independent protein translocase protein TatB
MSFGDTAFIFVLALLIFGPKKLPEIARQVGKALNEFKRASNEFKAQIQSEIDQLEVQEKKKKAEGEQKTMPPAEPPPGAVHSSLYSSSPEVSSGSALEVSPELPQDPLEGRPESSVPPIQPDPVNPPAHDATNA